MVLGWYRGGQMLTAELQPSRAIPVGQESEVADFHKARWQDVKHETADEFDRIQGYRLGAVVVLGIPPMKTDLVLFTAQQSAIRDGHPMGVRQELYAITDQDLCRGTGQAGSDLSSTSSDSHS